ncbi:MAG: NUMOD4 domain-containing protein [Bacteroidota bacterium]
MSKQYAIENYWNERWAPIDFGKKCKNRHYEVSNFGRIKSVEGDSGFEKLLKGSTSKNGFKMLNVRFEDGSRGGKYIHKVIAEMFLDRPSSDYDIVIHKDFDKENNHVKNLGWVTKEEWIVHLNKNPRFIEARQNQKHKLTESDVKMIKRMLLRGKQKRSTIARKFDISVTQVKRIERGENWKDVEAY